MECRAGMLHWNAGLGCGMKDEGRRTGVRGWTAARECRAEILGWDAALEYRREMQDEGFQMKD